VVRYFNAGVPQNAVTGAASTLTPRFTIRADPVPLEGWGSMTSRWRTSPTSSRTPFMIPRSSSSIRTQRQERCSRNVRDLTYSVNRPDLAALGARDGFMPSGLPISNNDPLSRRDAGLEFLT